MAITLTVNNTPFEFPEPGEQAPWGEGVTDWSTEVTKVLNSLSGPSDILETSAIIDNNVLIATPVGSFFFNPATVRSFSAECSVYRQANTSEISEQIKLVGLYTGAGGWILQQDGIGNAGITLDITSGGQITYTSTDFAGAPYSGIIKFRATGILST
jgi:hypothetical protein